MSRPRILIVGDEAIVPTHESELVRLGATTAVASTLDEQEAMPRLRHWDGVLVSWWLRRQEGEPEEPLGRLVVESAIAWGVPCLVSGDLPPRGWEDTGLVWWPRRATWDEHLAQYARLIDLARELRAAREVAS